jgi:SAM-dependent methyltransferase
MQPPFAIPPLEFIYLATAGNDTGVFLATGVADQQHVVRAIERAGMGANEQLRILDWGCGCGRIARHWVSAQNVQLFGCDVAEAPITWCQEHLPFAQFCTSQHDPPLPYPDSFFDVIYAASVLTHLTLESQFRWMQEIWRILKPSGIAMMTTHGPSLIPKILPNLSANAGRTSVTLIDEEIFICLNDEVGSNSTGAIQTRGMTQRIFFPFSVIDYRPRFGFMGIHDTNVLRKERDGEVVIPRDMLSAGMAGHSFRTSLQADLRGASALCAFVGIDDLLDPTQVTIRVGDRSSAPADIPMMVKWADLAGAYASLVIRDLDVGLGPVTIDVDVTSGKPLDGLTLKVPKLVAY